MKKLAIHKKAIAPIASLIVLMFTAAAVYAADRLIVKDASGNPRFIVDDNGAVTSDFEGTNSAGDGSTTLMNLIADNANTSKSSDVGFLLENNKVGFNWIFRTQEGAQGFSMTKGGTGGPELQIKNPSNNFQNVTLLLGNGAGSADGQWLDASSRDYKENIKDITSTEAMKTLAGLKPVKYHFKRDASKNLNVGFIAEDVPELVATKNRKSLSPLEIVAVLTKVVQEQQRMIAKLNDEMKTLKGQMKSSAGN